MGHEPLSAFLLIAYKALGFSAVIVTGAGLFAAVDFNHTITLGSILIGIIIVVVAGIFTLRSKIATIWREEAEGERAAKERLEVELANERADRIEFERQQQDLRHDLKNELATCKAQLQVMEAKTDLTIALDAIHDMNEQTVTKISTAIADIFVERSKQEHAKTHDLLREIRDKLPTESTFRDITDEARDSR